LKRVIRASLSQLRDKGEPKYRKGQYVVFMGQSTNTKTFSNWGKLADDFYKGDILANIWSQLERLIQAQPVCAFDTQEEAEQYVKEHPVLWERGK